MAEGAVPARGVPKGLPVEWTAPPEAMDDAFAATEPQVGPEPEAGSLADGLA